MAKKGIRLSKAAKDLNVGISTIVEFLTDKGVDVDSSPNSKLTGEMYEQLQQEFASDIVLKAAAKEVEIKLSKEEEESLAIEEDPIVSEPVVENIEIEKPKAPKLMGKIDLDKKPVKKEEPKQEESKPEEPQQDEPKAEEPQQEIVEEPKAKTEEVVEKTPPTTDDGKGPKVIDKIDLSSINEKLRPKKKSRKEIQAEKIQKKEAEKAIISERKAKEEIAKKEEKIAKELKVEPKKEEFVKTKIEKLSGPTVVGKIELPVEKPKSTEKYHHDDKKKKKKKRKRVKKVDTQKEIASQKGGGQRGNNSGTNNQKSNSRKKFRKGDKRAHKVEINEVDVQKQIKETLARLTDKSKNKSVKHRKDKRISDKKKQIEDLEQQELDKKILKVTEFISASELASMMDVSATEVVTICMNLGLFVSINQRIDAETITLVADEFGFDVEFISVELQEAIDTGEDKEDDLLSRAPIVTVMGHVDHGKTKLLDYIRKENVIAGEAGGITQHIGAYSVKLKNDNIITFLDTPGHEAFTAMRARGARVTDIAIIVVAADDGIMPQTVEAINHAQAAGVPIVFAINKIDKPAANPDKIKEQLANKNLLIEEWGGKIQSQDVSAITGEGVEDLLEKVILEAELLELKANPNKRANGSVIESELDKGRGYVATILVQSGTLKVGDVLIAGSYYGHAKAMYNERGENIKEAGPSRPVQLLGLNGAPTAGDTFNVMTSDSEAREIATKRFKLQREQSMKANKHITLDEIGRRLAIGNFQELNVILKGDVDGSIEALSDSLLKLSTEEIQVNIIHKAVGQISESDVMLASASDAVIIGFQVRPSVIARKLAEKEEIEIRLYSIIYDAINELRDAMQGMLSPEIREEVTATINVQEVFKITKVGTIAGCLVTDGKVYRDSNVRLIREGIVIYSGKLDVLKRFKDEAKEVVSGLECGISIKNYNDIKVGDVIEAFKQTEIARKL